MIVANYSKGFQTTECASARRGCSHICYCWDHIFIGKIAVALPRTTFSASVKQCVATDTVLCAHFLAVDTLVVFISVLVWYISSDFHSRLQVSDTKLETTPALYYGKDVKSEGVCMHINHSLQRRAT